MEKHKTVVVTGFGPFGLFPNENPSWRCVELLQYFPLPPDVDLQVRCIKVAYEDAQRQAEEIWCDLKPDFVIHTGVHQQLQDCLAVERQAFNFGYCCPDVYGKVPLDNCCSRTGFDTITCTVDVVQLISRLVRCLPSSNIGLKISDDPGRYLCGYLYYASLMNDPSKVLFVHVPCFTDIATPEAVAEVLRQLILIAVHGC